MRCSGPDAVPSSPLGRIGLDLMLAALAPNDQPHTGLPWQRRAASPAPFAISPMPLQVALLARRAGDHMIDRHTVIFVGAVRKQPH